MADNTEYAIARIAVIDEVSGESTPVNTRTIAKAVDTDEENKTAQDKFDEYNEHVSNLAIHSTAYVKNMVPLTIPVAGWQASTVQNTDFPYFLEIEVDGILDIHTVFVAIDNESLPNAKACGLCPTGRTLHNKIVFWSKRIPTDAMTASLAILGEGGLSNGANDESNV